MAFSKEELEAGFTAILAVWIRDYCDTHGGEEVIISRSSETSLLYETADRKMEIRIRDVTEDVANAKESERLRNILGKKTTG